MSTPRLKQTHKNLVDVVMVDVDVEIPGVGYDAREQTRGAVEVYLPEKSHRGNQAKHEAHT